MNQILNNEYTEIDGLLGELLDSPWYAMIVLKAIRDEKKQIIDFNWVWGNRKVAHIFSQLPISPGKKVSEIFHQASLNEEESRSFWYRMVTESHKPLEKEYAYKQEGEVNWYRERITKVNDGVLIMIENITSQKNNDIELERKNTLLQGVFDSTWSGIGVFEAVRNEHNKIVDFNFIMLNKSAKEMYAAHLADFDPKKGKLFSSVFPGGLKPNSNIERYARVVETGEPFQLEFFYPHDGLNDWIRESGIKYEDGLVVSTEIITEQKRKDEELRKSQELSQVVVDSSLSTICMLEAVRNSKGEIVDFVYRLTNKQLKIMFPNNPAEPGKKLSEIIPNSIATENFKRWSKATNINESYQIEYYYDFDGIRGWYRETGVPFSDGVILTIEDISNQKENEEKLRKEETLLLESQEIARIGAFEWAEDMSRGYWTAQLYKIYGVDPYSVEINAEFLDKLIHPEDKEKHKAALKKIRTQPEPYTIVYRAIINDGTQKHIWERGRYLNGRMVGTAMDITERRELEIKMEKLAMRNAELDTFVYTASHDLRSPVSNMETLLSFLDAEITHREENIEMYIKLLKKCITDLKATLRDLTQVTEIHSEKNELVNLSEIVDEVKSGLREQIQEAGASVKVKLHTPFLSIPRRHARSLAYNMLSNSLKFRSKNRPLVVNISCFLKDNKLQITFADNGIGIKSENLPRVFQIFKRFNPEIEGRGIGMYLVKRVIDLNNGDINIHSQENVGTTFHVTFPTS